MRILFLSQFFQPEPIFKGLPLARALQEAGHQVEVLTTWPNYPGGKIYPGYRPRLLQREWMDGILVTRVPVFPSHDASPVRRMANYLSFAASAAAFTPFVASPHLVYVYNLVTLGLAARIARLVHRSRVVLDVQDLWPESVLSSGMLRNGGAGRVLSHWCKYEYDSVDRLTVLSPGFKRHLVALGIPHEKIDVVYNWCDESDVRLTVAEAAQLRDKLGFAGRFNVVFAGTMGKMQALDTVIGAARELQHRRPQVRFTLVGGGIEVGHLQALAAGLENVHFFPQCPPWQAARILAVADALLVHLKADPLFEITIPSKTQAYLHAGRPILMGVRGDAAHLVSQADAGISFESENVASLVAAVGALVDLPQAERDRMGANGRSYYTRNLSFAQGVKQFDEVFRRAAE